MAVALVLVMGVVLGPINGTLVVLTRVPDIVVTLAMSLCLGRCRAAGANTPGGAAATG